jgi:endonuclease YncB( thermonuclease family)
MRQSIFIFTVVALLTVSGIHAPRLAAQDAKSLSQAYQELFERSAKEKKGLNIYVRGQTIGAVFVKVIGNDAIEVRNQTYGRIVIRLESIDAVAIN